MIEPKVRSFISIDLGIQVLDKIVAFQRIISQTGADIKLVEAKNIHITMRFLGEIPISLVNRISNELRNIQFNPFEVSLLGTGAFPNMRHINVIWVGIDNGLLELKNIHSQIDVGLKKLNISPDKRGFNPHITIARVRSSRKRNKLSEILLSGMQKKFGIFRVDSVKLKKSVLTPKGPIYTTLSDVSAAIK